VVWRRAVFMLDNGCGERTIPVHFGWWLHREGERRRWRPMRVRFR
jgi:hypothetical protein